MCKAYLHSVEHSFLRRKNKTDHLLLWCQNQFNIQPNKIWPALTTLPLCSPCRLCICAWKCMPRSCLQSIYRANKDFDVSWSISSSLATDEKHCFLAKSLRALQFTIACVDSIRMSNVFHYKGKNYSWNNLSTHCNCSFLSQVWKVLKAKVPPC